MMLKERMATQLLKEVQKVLDSVTVQPGTETEEDETKSGDVGQGYAQLRTPEHQTENLIE